jgi:hypothetical protein
MLDDATDATDATATCPAAAGGRHRPDQATVTHGRDTPEGVVDVSCRSCGASGSFRLDPEAIRW